jgi:hypothetical protein
LADADFAQNIYKFRKAANSALTTLTQRMSMPHLAGENNPRSLLASDASRRKFANMMAAGLGQQWTAALAGVRQAPAPMPASVRRIRRLRARSVLHPRDVLAQPGVADAITENLGEIIDSVAQWLDKLSQLYPLPFSYLVPDPRMLPVESIRFFYIDPNWIAALTAGAMSIAIHGSQDVALYKALLPSFTASNGGDMSGMLIRSQLVSGWPKLAVSATVGGAPVGIVRNDCLAPNVRLVLFDGIPDTVRLAEPYQGILFGVEDDGIYPRCVTSSALTGALIANAAPVSPSFRTPSGGNGNGVLEVQTVASVLASAAGIVPFASDAVVQWNGTALQTTFVSGNQLTAVVPANSVASQGTAAVTVSAGGVSSLPAMFVINAQLTIDAINPAIMQAGGNEFVLTVLGTGFDTTAVVNWNDSALTTTVISSTEATAVVPANLITNIGTAAITVLSNSVTSGSMTLNIVGGDPVIDTLQPNIAMAGGTGFTLTVSGSGFTANAVVQWNGISLATAFVSERQLTAAVAASLIASAAGVSVTVMVNGTDSAPVAFTIANRQPTIGSLQPSVAMAGGAEFQLIVDGVNFGADAQVQWNGTNLTSTFDDAGQLTAAVPATLLTAAGTVSVSVLSGKVSSNVMNFTVIGPQPAIGLLEPAAAVAGCGQFTLTVTGGFGAGDFALQMVAAPELQSFTTG